MIVGMYVLSVFRRLLNERYGFHDVDNWITTLMLCYGLAALIGFAGLALISQSTVITATLIVYGTSSLVSIVYAAKLLRLEFDLSGLLRPYAYTTIASGICGVTIVLGPLGNLIFMVSLIVLGIILIRARAESEYL
jgi:hypothetical protein